MSNEKKTPDHCNHCNSTDIVFHSWGRVEYWSCKSCKKEVTYVEPTTFGSPWGSWDPKTYGFGSSDLKLPPGTQTNFDFLDSIGFDNDDSDDF